MIIVDEHLHIDLKTLKLDENNNHYKWLVPLQHQGILSPDKDVVFTASESIISITKSEMGNIQNC